MAAVRAATRPANACVRPQRWRALNALRTSEELVHAFTYGCAAEVCAVGGGYRARAFGFTATSTAGRYHAVRNWIDQVLLKAGAEGQA